MYAETESNKYSSVVILVRANATFRGLDSLRDSKACFPEYGGIAKVTFVNAAKAEGLFPQNNCNFSVLLGEFFGQSCVPGASDPLHDPSGHTPENICSLCRHSVMPVRPIVEVDASVDEDRISKRSVPMPRTDGEEAPVGEDGEEPPVEDEEPPAGDEEETPVEDPTDEELYPEYDEEKKTKVRQELDRIPGNCNADATNRYYGNQGALRCLAEVGDVAVVELQYLKSETIAST